jgi:hypothetical protein
MTDVSFDFADSVFRLCPQAVMEGFEEGALLLRLEDRHLFELNPVTHFILLQTDGQRDAVHVADALAEAFQISHAEALQETISSYGQLSAQGVIEVVEPGQDGKEISSMEEAPAVARRYIRNPDVVLREEDEEGGLLFNPDTGQIRVINPTSLFIWQQCDGTRDLDEIATAMQEAFDEEVPSVDQLVEDVRGFVEEMVETGFIGIPETLESGD